MSKCKTCGTPNKTIKELRALRKKAEDQSEKTRAQSQIIKALRKELGYLKLQNKRFGESRDIHRVKFKQCKENLSFQSRINRERKRELSRVESRINDIIFSHNRELSTKQRKIEALQKRLDRLDKAVKLIKGI